MSEYFTPASVAKKLAKKYQKEIELLLETYGQGVRPSWVSSELEYYRSLVDHYTRVAESWEKQDG